jgi:glycosyltransferase involved in cell wall biosynthesis
VLIAVNGKALLADNKGGAARVALDVIRHIAVAHPDFSIHVFLPVFGCGFTDNLNLPKNVTYTISRSRFFKSSFLKSLLWEQILLPFLVRQGRFDLLFNPSNSAPVFFDVGSPQVLLLHDTGFLNRRWFTGSFSRYLDFLVKAAVKKRVHFVTVSRSVADEIERAYSVPASFVYNALDQAPDHIDPPDVEYKYILFLGSINPRKNLRGAIEGYRLFRQGSGSDLHLVIIGGEKKHLFVSENFDNLQSEDIVFTGYVDEQTKWRWLNGAELLLFPSFLEGFGLPVLEALHVGTPVVASRIPVFLELFEDAVEYVDPHSPEDICRGISRILADAAGRERRIQRGFEITRKFSWNDCVEGYVKLFEQVTRAGGAGKSPRKW